MQTDILDRGPDNREATGFRGEDIDLIGALPHIAEETLNGISGLNVSMHRGRKRIKRQEVLFILSQAADRFWIALRVLGFEGSELGQGLLLCGLLPDANEFGLDIAALSPRDRIEHVALLMHETALARGGRKQFRDSPQQAVMPIGHDQIDLRCPSCSQVVQEAEPSLFALLGTGPQSQHFFVSREIDAQCGQDDGGIALVPMTNAEMHAIEVQDTPVLLKRALSPGFELLRERVVQTTDRARAGSDTHQRLGHFPDFLRAHSGHEHLGESFGDVGFIATVAFEGLGVVLAFTVAGHLDLFESTRRRNQIAGIGTIAIAFAFRTTLSPGHSEELV